jgi:signal transduction histidine kinase
MQAMIHDVEQFSNAKAARIACAPSLLSRTTERIQNWFRRPDHEQRDRELHIRLDERYRERARIARELHDTLFQGFLGASMQIHDAVEQMPADSPCKSSLSSSLILIRSVIDEGREVLQGLRSSAMGSMTLEQALSELGNEFTPRGTAPFRLFVKGHPKTLRSEVQEQVYMIGREALANALRHSKATSIEAEVEYLPRRLRVVVRDNGCGMDPQVIRSGRERHWGLRGMQERAGSISAQLRIWSRPGAGTEVEVSVPNDAAAAACA